MIKCPNCGEELVAGTIYCSNCGELVGEKPKPEVIIDEDSVKKAYFEGMVEAFKFIIIPLKEQYWSSEETLLISTACTNSRKRKRYWSPEETLLISTVKYKNKDILKAMLKAGFYPLHYAAKHGNKDLLNAVLETGLADINQVDTEGNTALMLAAENGYEDAVNALLETGLADIDQVNTNGNTALMLAAKNGNNKIVKALIEAGADVNKTNKYNKSAIDLARDYSNSYTVGILHKAGAVDN